MGYSIRMRAAQGGAHEQGGKHISGAERLVSKETLETTAVDLIRRALNHSKGEADFIRLTIDKIPEEQIKYIPALKIEGYEAISYEDGRAHALEFLQTAGVSNKAANQAMTQLLELGENMRGALLIDAKTGERLDKTAMRGIRVTKMDFAEPKKAVDNLKLQGYTNVHLHEALVLASKVLSTPGIIAELCWSDDPDYIVGYVSGKGRYHRISKMKPMASELGGRVFFVETGKSPTEIAEIIAYLQEQVTLVKTPE